MPSPTESAPPKGLRGAASHVRYLLKGVDGVSGVEAGDACIIVYVRGGNAAKDARSTVGVNHKGHPIVYRSGRQQKESAGILTIYPTVR